jgi:hypothetical protein
MLPAPNAAHVEDVDVLDVIQGQTFANLAGGPVPELEPVRGRRHCCGAVAGQFRQSGRTLTTQYSGDR